MNLVELLKQKLLVLDSRKYRLEGIIGRGGSSIVYLAAPEDDTFKDYLIIKELFPHGWDIERELDGEQTGALIIPPERIDEFEKIKSRVYREAEIVEKLKNDRMRDSSTGQSNSGWFLSYREPIAANNTLYTIITTESGKMLSEKLESKEFYSFETACDCILKILNALEPIHRLGYLHLDISPDNIHCSDTGIVRLIDYNSAFEENGNIEEWIPSYKPGYSASEVISTFDTKVPKLIKATDLYSVAAIFFEILTGRRPGKDGDWSRRRSWLLSNETGFLAGASSLLVKQVNAFLVKGISLTPENRFQDVYEMREAVEELRKLSVDYTLMDLHKHPNEHFVCRERDLENIHKKLDEDGDSHIILYGLAGNGKTELSKMYAERYKEFYDTVQFVRFSGSIMETVGNNLRFSNFYDEYYTGENAVVEKFYAKLERLSKYDERTLIIIDNCNIELDDEYYKRLTSGKYKVIITSRIKLKDTAYEVKPLESDDLMTLFKEYCGDGIVTDENLPVIQEIITLLGNHTMSVMLTALALRETDKTPDDILAKLKESGVNTGIATSLPIEKEDIAEAERYKEMYGHILALFDMAEIKKNRNYAYIMTNMALVSYSGIKRTDFYNWTLSKRYKKETYDDLNMLNRLGWIQNENTVDNNGQRVVMLSLHPVISDIAWRTFKPNSKKCRDLIEGLIQFANECADKTYIERKNGTSTLELACVRLNEQSELLADLYYSYAKLNVFLSDIEKARKWHEKGLVIRENILGYEHPKTATSYEGIGGVCVVEDKQSDALDYYQKAYGIYRSKLGNYHNNTIGAMIGVAALCLDIDNYKEALKLYHMLREIQEKHNNESLASTYIGIGNIHAHHCAYAEALTWYQKAKTLQEELHIKNSDLALTYHNIANVYNNQMKYTKALEFCEKARLLCEDELGSNHLNTCTIYKTLAKIYENKEMYTEALMWLHKVLSIYTIIFGNEHRKIADIYDKIAYVYELQNNYDEAIEWYHKALSLRENANNVNTSDTATNYNNIATIFLAKRDFEEALKWYQKALFIRETVLGANHPDTGITLLSVEVCYLSAEVNALISKNYTKALQFHYEVLSIHEKTSRLDHPVTHCELYKTIAEFYDAINEKDRAYEYYNIVKLIAPKNPDYSQNPIHVVKVGRNEPCPCGSGKKYKKCCGR